MALLGWLFIGWLFKLDELVPRFRAEAFGMVTKTCQKSHRLRVNLPFRLAARAKGTKLSCAELVQDRFRQDRAR
jgi:hypothetical protein